MVATPVVPSLTLKQAFFDGTWQLHYFEQDVPSTIMALGDFSLKSAYGVVRLTLPVQQSLHYIWRPEIALKNSIFMWRLLNNLLPLADVLMSIAFSMPSKCLFYDDIYRIPESCFLCL